MMILKYTYLHVNICFFCVKYAGRHTVPGQASADAILYLQVNKIIRHVEYYTMAIDAGKRPCNL